MATVNLAETRLTAIALVRLAHLGDFAGAEALAAGTEDQTSALVATASVAMSFLREASADPLAVLDRLVAAALAEEEEA